MSKGRWGKLLIVLGVIIFAVYLAYTNPFSILLEAGRFNPWLFLGAVAVNCVGLLFLAGSWHMLLKAMDIKVSLWRTIQVTFVSLFVVFLMPIPSGFEIIRAYLVKDDEGSNVGKAVSSVMVSKVYYFVGFSVILLTAAFVVVVLGGSEIPVRPELVWLVVAYAFLNTLIFGVFLTPKLLNWIYCKSPPWVRHKLLDRVYSPELGLGGFDAFVQELEWSVQALRRRPLDNLLSVLMVGLHWSCGAITTYLVAMSLGEHISFWVIVLIYGVIEFIQQLNVVIPSGLGVVDAGLTGALTVIGVPLNVAAAISLLTRLATYWLELVICGAVSLQFGYKDALRDYLG